MDEIGKLTEENIHFEKGRYFDINGNVADNPRFINQSHLSEIAPNFIPQLAVPNERIIELAAEYPGFTFPVEKIDGPQWSMMVSQPQREWKGKTIIFTFKDHIDVARQTLEQMQFLYEQYKILLTDRNETNVLLKLVEDKTDSSKWMYQVYQVDFGSVYDAVNDTNFIANDVNLNSRTQEKNQGVKDKDKTKQNIARQIRLLADIVSAIAKNPKFNNSISEKMRESVKKFEQKWNKVGISTSNEYLDFETVKKFLDDIYALSSI